MNWKKVWSWICGLLGGPLVILTPYIAEWNFHLPNEVKGALALSILGGLGLVNMKRPTDHDEK